ncbi:MAG: hypothetical protein Q7T74_02530, partial [Candidatus Saccharibacteria bacterium]|nr:hypothetical protein [Candidatus Saccharibacteria bacterium]
DPNGNIAKYVRDGFLDKHTQKKRISEITFPDGKVVTRDYQYDGKTGLSYETEKHSTGLFVETWNDIHGREKKKLINGELVSTTEYTNSENKPHVLSGANSFDPEDNDRANAGYCTITGGLPLWKAFSGRGIPGHTVKIPPPAYMGCSNTYIVLTDDYNSPSYEHDRALAELKNREDPIIRRNPDAAQPQAYIKIKTVTDVSGNKTSHEYDQWNNEVKITYPNGSSISRTWHAKYDFLLTETNEKGIVTAYDYDAKGNLLTLTKARGAADERITRFTYDEFGQVKTVTTGESAANNTALVATSYEYDQYGNITKVTDPEGNITTYGDYDALGNAKAITDARSNLLPVADQYTWKNTYDNAGNVLTRRDPYGKGETYTYNKIGHLETITSASGSKVTLTTNANGQPLTMTDDNGK